MDFGEGGVNVIEFFDVEPGMVGTDFNGEIGTVVAKGSRPEQVEQYDTTGIMEYEDGIGDFDGYVAVKMEGYKGTVVFAYDEAGFLCMEMDQE